MKWGINQLRFEWNEIEGHLLSAFLLENQIYIPFDQEMVLRKVIGSPPFLFLNC